MILFGSKMGTCKICGKSSPTISGLLGVCASCLRSFPEYGLKYSAQLHEYDRKRFGLPLNPPRGEVGAKCNICVNECVMRLGERGFCGIWTNSDGVLKNIFGSNQGVLHYYYDPIPTNCVATPVCPAATGSGYPKYAVHPQVEAGYYNLAVFFAGCSLNCLYCQNWEHKEMLARSIISWRNIKSADELKTKALDRRVTCVCYFGGDPGPQIVYALKLTREILRESQKRNQIKRICWETNGLVHPLIFEEMARLSLESGGIVKIDWKAWTPVIYQALTGVNGDKALERIKLNVKRAWEIGLVRSEIPLLVVSTLLVPGYVDENEVKGIAEYLASISQDIPFVLLAFHPDHLLADLPPTSRSHVKKAYEMALAAGLKRVFIGNEWLLSDYY